jgi:hypothetical protein
MATRKKTPAGRQYARAWMADFLEQFAKGANITKAALATGICRASVYHARARDKSFSEGWQEALEEAQDRIRAEVDRRAIEGWEEPVIGSIGNYRDGHLLGHDGKPLYIRKFDSGLLARLAVAHCPEFKEKSPVAATVNVTIQVTPERLQQLQERRRVQLDNLALARN